MYWDIQYQFGNFLVGILGSATTIVVVGLITLWFIWFIRYLIPGIYAKNEGKWLWKRVVPITVRVFVGIFLIMSFASIQTNAPKITLGVPQVTIENPYKEGEWKETAPVVMTDEERMQQQRALDEETKNRVNLND